MKIDLSKTSHIVLFVVILPFLSVALVLTLNYVLSPMSGEWYFPLIDTLGFFSSYAFLYSRFNHWAWKLPLFKALGVVSFPNLNGLWEGGLISSFDERKKQFPAKLFIKQTFSDIYIELTTDTSSSYSLETNFVETRGGKLELAYTYLNEPNEKAQKTMHAHKGFARFVITDTNTLEGSYFNENNHERGHTGSLSFRRKGHA